MVTRVDITRKIKNFKSDIRLKDISIKKKLKASQFKGLTVKAQLKIGSSKAKHKTFRKERKQERRDNFRDIGILGNDRQLLTQGLLASEDDLFVFDNQLLQEGKL